MTHMKESGMDGWREEEFGPGAKNHKIKKKKQRDDILPYLSICYKLQHLFTIYFIYFADAGPGLINIFCSVCCLLERGLIGTR